MRLFGKDLLIACIVSIFLLLLFGCSANDEGGGATDETPQGMIEQPGIADAANSPTPDAESTPNADNDPPAATPGRSGIEGSISLYVYEMNLEHMREFIRAFSLEYPDVDVEIETYSIIDIYERSGEIIAKMRDESADITDTSGLMIAAVAPFDEETLFADLNPMIDGENGTDREIYYDNILRACETDAKLYHVPILFEYELVSLNNRIMAEIGLDPSEMQAVSYEDELRLYQIAAELHPDDTIYLYRMHSVMEVLSRNWSNCVDFSSGAVNIDTAQMREMLETAAGIPSKGTFTEYGMLFDVSSSGLVNDLFYGATDKYLVYRHNSASMPYLCLLSGISEMLYSKPVPVSDTNGNFPFTPVFNLSISKESENPDIAWEFVRFCMESERCSYREQSSSLRPNSFMQSSSTNIAYNLPRYLPVNKNRLWYELEIILNDAYNDSIAHGRLVPAEDEAIAEYEKAWVIEKTIMEYSGLTAMCNYEFTGYYGYNDSYDAIRDNIYLFVTGEQDAAAALGNIQKYVEKLNLSG